MRSAACFGRNCSALRNLKRNASLFTNVVDPSSVASILDGTEITEGDVKGVRA